MKAKSIIFFLGAYFLIFSLMGCDAFVRKFTRKPKKVNLPVEEMVIAPQEYIGPQMSREELYRQHFLFWKSWQDELIVSLRDGKNQKKQMDCVEQAIMNLENLKLLIKQQAQEKLDSYINQEKELKESIDRDIFSNNITNNISTAERIKRNILRDFSYKKISEDIS